MKKNNFKIVLWGLVFLGFWSVPYFAIADEATSTTIHLDIETATTTLYNAELAVSACATTASGTPQLSAYCAVVQTGLDTQWSDYGDDKFLTSISGAANDDGANQYWGWFSNLEYGQTSLNQHILLPGESLLVTIGRQPLKLTVATTTVSVTHFAFDESWNPVWLPAASSTLSVNGTSFPVAANGVYDLATSSGTLTLQATEDGFLASNSVTVTVTESLPVESPIADPTPVSSSGGGASGERHGPDVSAALQFLASKQKADGSFGAALYTDWAGIALAVGPASAARVSSASYLQNQVPILSSATDYERHAMALMALGSNPYTSGSNYIQKIIDQFDGNQIGDANLVNDDVFALFPLLKAGYSSNDSVISKIVAFILSKQMSNGSWEGSVDLTAAAVQALSLVRSLSGVNQAMSSARSYLLAQQKPDGGFGSSFSTSWVVQAIAALGENVSAWTQENNTPLDALAAAQQSDGGFEPVSSSETTRVWATAYAIPAILGEPWPGLLSAFSKAPTLAAPIQNLTQSTSTIALATTTHVLAITPKPVATTTFSAFSPKVVLDNVKKNPPSLSPEIAPLVPSDPIPLSATTSLALAAAGKSEVPLQTYFFIVSGVVASVGSLYLYKILKK